MRILFSVLLMSGFVAHGWAEPPRVTGAAPSTVPSPAPVSSPASSNTPAGAEKKSTVTFESLAQMNELIELGMPALALSLLEDEQKKRPSFTADWYAFEYKRILLLAALERWQQLIDRTQWLFDTARREKHITKKIRLWFETQQVIARLQLKQSAQALSQLQTLLWASKPEYRDQSLPAIWRRLVVRAYLQMHNHDDARKALLKYERDYQTDETDIDWSVLRAQILLKTNRPQQALQLLNKISAKDAIDIEALKLIAQLQVEPKKAKKINKQMRELLDGKVLSQSARWAYSYVAYLASKLLSDQSAQIFNLESMLSLDIKYPLFDESYQVTADDLWGLYNKQGSAIANKHGLLFGNDAQWQQLSDKLVGNAPGKALALNAALVLNTKNFSTKQPQHQTIVEIIEQRKNGLELINKLYLKSNKVANVDVLPDEVRYRLVDYALSQGDTSAAAKIMKSLQEPPPGKTLFEWRMRNARVLVLQGEYKQSENLIRKTFSEKPSITHEELDRYIQVVFDFQTVQQHSQAIKLFDLLYFEGLDENLKREIYFWKAESYYAMEKYDRAALFYLESARALTGGYNDLWAQSARFKAAQALLKAEIYEDAEKVNKDLFLVTASKTRKALITQNLQKIRLLKSATGKQ